MSVKKLLILTAASAAALVGTAALAGGPEVYAPAVPGFQPHVYIEGNLGYAWVDWRHNFFGLSPFDPTVNISNGTGGFAGGGDIGYMFTRNLGIEIGAYYLPSATGTAFGSPPFNGGNSLKVNEWFAYAAGRLSVPIYQNIDLFGKAGAAVRWLNYTGAGVNGTGANNSYWAPTFAIGAKYQITDSWSANIMYTRVSGYQTFNNNTTNFGKLAPAVNMLTGGIGFEFAV